MKNKVQVKSPIKVKYDFDFNGKSYFKEASVIMNRGKVSLINLNLGKVKIPVMLKELIMMRVEAQVVGR